MSKKPEDEIKKLKEVALGSGLISVKNATIDTLSTYGQMAIPTITEIVSQSSTEEVRVHGLAVIQRLKSTAEVAK
jgi:hypothetical protein